MQDQDALKIKLKLMILLFLFNGILLFTLGFLWCKMCFFYNIYALL